MKKLLLVVIAILLILSFSVGCSQEKAPAQQSFPILNNSLDSGSLELQHSISGFSLITKYSTTYNTKEWHITDSKMLDMKAYTSGADKYVVMVEHVHVDTALQSIYAGLHGWGTDSMDDKLAVGNQPGFWITDKYYYQNVFAIEGYSDRLISGWSFYYGGFGAGGVTEYRLTEANIVKYGGVYGQKIQAVYDILVKTPDEPYFHTYSIIDEFVIPVKK
jgi:hypothetical protein